MHWSCREEATLYDRMSTEAQASGVALQDEVYMPRWRTQPKKEVHADGVRSKRISTFVSALFSLYFSFS